MSFVIPKGIKWSVVDFKDLYKTMCEFKKRFMARREIGNKCECVKCNDREIGCGINEVELAPFCWRCNTYHPKDQECLMPR